MIHAIISLVGWLSTFVVLVPVLCGGGTLWLLWRQDRPWKGMGHFSGLISISLLVSVIGYFVLVPLLGAFAWWVLS